MSEHVGVVLAAETFQFIQMKKFMFAACAALMSLTLSAQQNTQAVKTNPLGFFAGQYQVAYERALNDNFSVQLSAGFIGGTSEGTLVGDSLEITTETYNKTGFIAIPEVRWYPGGSACEGFYIAALGRFRSATTVNESDDVILERTANGAAVVWATNAPPMDTWSISSSDRNTRR